MHQYVGSFRIQSSKTYFCYKNFIDTVQGPLNDTVTVLFEYECILFCFHQIFTCIISYLLCFLVIHSLTYIIISLSRKGKRSLNSKPYQVSIHKGNNGFVKFTGMKDLLIERLFEIIFIKFTEVIYQVISKMLIFCAIIMFSPF